MKALFSRLAIAALICMVQSQSRGYGQRPMQMYQGARRLHRAQDMSGREALAIAMFTLKQVQELFEKYRWADLFGYPDLSITLPGHDQVHAEEYSPQNVERGHPWIVLELPPKKPKGQPRNSRPWAQYAVATPPVQRPVPPRRTARQRPPFPRW